MAGTFRDRLPRLVFLGVAGSASAWSYWLGVSAGRTAASLLLWVFGMVMLTAWGALFFSAKKHDPDWDLINGWP